MTAPKLLQAAGYYTGMVGKWHLGSDPTGFDYWNILPGQGRYVDPVFYTQAGARIYPGYVTDVTTDLGLQFLEKRPQEKPFFLMLHQKAPHREWTPDEKHRAQFASRTIPVPPTLLDDYSTRGDAIRQCTQKLDDLTRRDLKLEPPAELKGRKRQEWLATKPASVKTVVEGKSVTLTGEPLLRWKYQRYLQDYLACVQSVDDNVGRLLDWLDAHGLRENTVVIYTSDQGFFLGDHGLFDKRFMYEESLKMPLLVRGPGVQKGVVEKAMVTNCDFAQTFLALAEAAIPSEMQGRSLTPLLKGEHPADWRKAMYYRYYHDPGHHHTAAHYGICTETHKLIYFWKLDQWELYDLTKDPTELHNLYQEPSAQALVAELKAELQRQKAAMRDEDQYAEAQPVGGVDGGRPRWAPGFQPSSGQEEAGEKEDPGTLAR
jgi:arylsulfatase A-like enzyme